jgi:hypothetical protein
VAMALCWRSVGDKLRRLGGLFLLALRDFRCMLSAGTASRARYCLASLLLCCVPSLCPAEAHSVLCTDGTGTFEDELFTRVQVRVGATKKGALAVRSCEATLSWNDRKLVVASDIPVLDLDAFAVDMGLGAPVAAFQLKQSKDDCCVTYRIYSLQKPPKLLRTLTGGSFFAAADTDLDGRVEIWTDDTAAVNGLDNLTPAEWDFSPPMVLRFEKGKLLDVSSEFAPDFDKRIEKLRAQLLPEDLRDFKSSDGQLLSSNSSLAEQIHRLRGIKVQVLEVVWSYLYSGRDQDAWRSLSEMWPASDADRIREILLKAHAAGIRAQLDGVSTLAPVTRKAVRVFTPSTSSPEVRQPSLGDLVPDVDEASGTPQITEAIPILARSSPVTGAEDPALLERGLTAVLVIDAAGKIRSATATGSTAWMNSDIMTAFSQWKFVPAFKGHQPVASSMVKIYSLQQ